MELCIRCREALLVMGVIVPLLLILDLKNKYYYILWRKGYVVASKTGAY